MARKFVLALCLLIVACASAPSIPFTPTTLITDPELDAAVEQARDSLDTFIERIATPHADRTFVAVKVRFHPPGELPQDMWVDGVTYEGGAFHGNMGDDIPSLRLGVGDTITIKEEDIIDWMLVEDGQLVGGYTIRLAVKRMSPEEKERFFETVDYSIED